MCSMRLRLRFWNLTRVALLKKFNFESRGVFQKHLWNDDKPQWWTTSMVVSSITTVFDIVLNAFGLHRVPLENYFPNVTAILSRFGLKYTFSELRDQVRINNWLVVFPFIFFFFSFTRNLARPSKKTSFSRVPRILYRDVRGWVMVTAQIQSDKLSTKWAHSMAECFYRGR